MAAVEITETVLEMHFHAALMDCIRSTLGLAPTTSMHFFKYSPQNETFVGFDQAYARTTMSSDEFLAHLRQSAMYQNYDLHSDDRFIGYFLQYKTVRRMQNRTGRTPPQLVGNRRGSAHYRSELQTTRLPATNRSQHELLYGLNRNRGALVYYACPMLFDRTQLYEAVDLDQLRLADVSSCPGPYLDNDRHYIYFQDPHSDPIWCSEPTVGEAVTPHDFAELVRGKLWDTDPDVSRDNLLKLLSERDVLPETDGPAVRTWFNRKLLTAFADALTIIRLGPKRARG